MPECSGSRVGKKHVCLYYLFFSSTKNNHKKTCFFSTKKHVFLKPNPVWVLYPMHSCICKHIPNLALETAFQTKPLALEIENLELGRFLRRNFSCGKNGWWLPTVTPKDHMRWREIPMGDCHRVSLRCLQWLLNGSGILGESRRRSCCSIDDGERRQGRMHGHNPGLGGSLVFSVPRVPSRLRLQQQAGLTSRADSKPNQNQRMPLSC